MRILIYVGYQSVPFNPDTIKESGIGGTELACIKLSRELKRFGWDVTVSGRPVEEGAFDGVSWVSLDNLEGDFDVIVSASYIHFLLEFKESKAKKILWVHNTEYFPWWKGKEIPESESLLHEVDATVCLTEWHRAKWTKKYGVSNIHVIGNGIDRSSFHGRPTKVKNQFIWSSAPSRGLGDLLDNWHKVLKFKPDATLCIYYPKYASGDIAHLQDKLDQPGVKVLGSVSQEELHTAMLKSEYWCYLTGYEETYCITALEMQYAKVLPIATNVAALDETIRSGIILNYDEDRFDTAFNVLSNAPYHLQEKSREDCWWWAKNQTWSSRSYDWKKLIESL